MAPFSSHALTLFSIAIVITAQVARRERLAFMFSVRAKSRFAKGRTLRNSAVRMLPALLLIPLVALYRVLLAWHPGGMDDAALWLTGFVPLSAVAWCAGAYLPRRLALLAPLSILAISDVIIDAHYGAAFFTAQMAVRYLLLAAIALCALGFRGRINLPVTLAGTLAGSVTFYALTNAFCWLGSPDYPQTAAGLWQALTVGIPGYLPSWYFFRNALVSDGLYSILFVVCLRAAEPAPVRGFDGGNLLWTRKAR